MLDLSEEHAISPFPWDECAHTTHLPKQLQAFFDRQGMTPAQPDSRRAYRRFYLRSKAIVRRGDELLGVYTADASRGGIRFLSPIELEPKERVRIRLPKTKEFQIQINRCRKIEDGCYECGATFVIGSANV